jgi:hypothetical protein
VLVGSGHGLPLSVSPGPCLDDSKEQTTIKSCPFEDAMEERVLYDRPFSVHRAWRRG